MGETAKAGDHGIVALRPVQMLGVALMRALGDAEHLDWAERHHAVIARFGRFPHRNAILGRTSSEEEEAWFLTQAGSSF